MFSYPIRTTEKGWEIVEGVKHNAFGQEKFDITYKELLAEKEAVKEILL